MWIIQSGNPGDHVVVECQQNLKPGMTVRTKPFKGEDK